MVSITIAPKCKLKLMLRNHICMEEFGETAEDCKLIKVDLTNLVVTLLLIGIIALKLL